MDIADMHINFRQYAQQMGMQNTRGILPEQIDILINQSAIDAVNQLVKENVGITKDKNSTTNTKIGQINALKPLHHVSEKPITFEDGLFSYDKNDSIKGLIKHINNDETDLLLGEYMFLIDMSINYVTESGTVTNWYPVRVIEDIYLAETLNDYILKNKFNSPIAVISDKLVELYIDKFENDDTPKIKIGKASDSFIYPNSVRISTIQYPSKVKYFDDVAEGDQSVDCNLPDFMHGDIVRHAVELYISSVGGFSNRNVDNRQ